MLNVFCNVACELRACAHELDVLDTVRMPTRSKIVGVLSSVLSGRSLCRTWIGLYRIGLLSNRLSFISATS